ncbi:MAG: eL32 family ribosomal protein [Nanoarchaeota archaeon]|nr:eL32 family ribosomal protein [Nanoarchaeota archaeon]
MPKKFLRQDTRRHLRLGKRRRKLQKWRNPRGRHNKVRRQRRNYPARVKIGYGTPRETSGKIDNLTPVLVHNLKELSVLKKDSLIIIARVGARKKLDIIKKANESGFKIMNLSGGNSK